MSHILGRARIAVLVFVIALMTPTLAAAAASPQQDVRQADTVVQQATAQLSEADTAEAADVYNQYRAQWRQIEDGVKDASPQDYQAIETAQRVVRASLLANPPDATRAQAALNGLH